MRVDGQMDGGRWTDEWGWRDRWMRVDGQMDGGGWTDEWGWMDR